MRTSDGVESRLQAMLMEVSDVESIAPQRWPTGDSATDPQTPSLASNVAVLASSPLDLALLSVLVKEGVPLTIEQVQSALGLTLKKSAVDTILDGTTTVDEVYRVVSI